jgi:NTP pyrophosphatase (non-canonical NTP hydrolase)
MNIRELIEESHKISREKGFWDGDKNHSETVLFIIANVGDVVKARREKRMANWVAYSSATIGIEDHKDIRVKVAFEEHIKDTFEDEIANVMIRICDFLGGTRVKMTELQPWTRDYVDFPLNEFFLHAQVSGRYDGKLAEWLHNALWECAAYSKEDDHGLLHLMCYLGTVVSEMGIDIERHIETKLEYNKTRPKLYGRKKEL